MHFWPGTHGKSDDDAGIDRVLLIAALATSAELESGVYLLWNFDILRVAQLAQVGMISQSYRLVDSRDAALSISLSPEAMPAYRNQP